MTQFAGYDVTDRQLAALHGLYCGLVNLDGSPYGRNVRRSLEALAEAGIIARTGMGAYMIPWGSPGAAIIAATPDFVISEGLR